MATDGTPMPMQLPSGQVIWVRVSDDWTGDDADTDTDPDADVGHDEPPQPVPYGGAPGPAPTQGSAPASGSGSPYGYPPAPQVQPYPPYPVYPPQPQPQPQQQQPQQQQPSLRQPPRLPPPPPPQPVHYGPGPGPDPDSATRLAPIAEPQPSQHGRFGRRRPRPPVPTEDPRKLLGFTDAVSGIAESVRAGLLHAAPDTVEIEFGLDIDVTSGVAISLIADARAKAAVRIKLGWERPPVPADGSDRPASAPDAGVPALPRPGTADTRRPRELDAGGRGVGDGGEWRP